MVDLGKRHVGRVRHLSRDVSQDRTFLTFQTYGRDVMRRLLTESDMCQNPTDHGQRDYGLSVFELHGNTFLGLGGKLTELCDDLGRKLL